MSISMSWWDDKGLVVPTPIRKIKDDDFRLVRVAAEKSEELQSVILKRLSDSAFVYITCWHNETTISIFDPREKRMFVKAHEVFDSYANAYDFWKDMSYTAVIYPHVANNIYTDINGRLAENMDIKRFMEMHPDWNSYVSHPYNISHDMEYWNKQRAS